ncbi:nucleoporin p58/p45 isoform X2 [Dendrobates tinctorius]|uniref:nucleoporin p58/p45 isoform X2 n=1 Tax=Dendrobates tinctorius TaxID=92724 RepID=UPI003CC9B552
MSGGFSFGAAGSTTTTLNPATAAAAPFSFGGTPAASNTGTSFGFGASAAPTTTAQSTTGLSGTLFGAKPTTGFTLGLTNTVPATTSASTTGFSLNFGKPAGSATPFSLPAATTSTTGFSLSATPATGTVFSLNLGTSTPAAATTATTTGLSLGTLSGLTASPFQNAGVMASGLGQNTLGLAAPAAQTTTNEGLGGIDFSGSSDKKSDKAGARPEDSKALKDENLPQLICQDVETFQKFVKEQKQVQEEISRMSSKAMTKVENEIKALKQLLSVASSGLQRNTLAIDKLKIETAQELKNAEIALRTQKTPPGLQHENTAPTDYFRALVEQFEVQLQQYRQQIEELENHLATQANSSHLTPQDLSMAMQKLYQTFVALAAQLHIIHENVKMLKEQYLGYRKAFLGDPTDVFEARRAEAKKWQSAPRVTTGPTPFSNIPNAAAVAMAATLTQQQQPATGFGSSSAFGGNTSGASTFGFGAANKPSGSLSAGFGSSSTSGFNFSNPGINASAGLTFGVSNSSSAGFGPGSQLLQLKKPPAGNKRGKR